MGAPWANAKAHLGAFLALLILPVLYSLASYLPMLSLALSQVHVYGQPDVVDPGSRMTDFADLVGILGAVSNFFSRPVFFPFLLMLGGAGVLAVVYRLSFRWGSRSDYLMGRLPDRWELARRSFRLPLVLALVTLGVMALLLVLFYALDLALTPAECLQPDQLGKLWTTLVTSSPPTMKGGYPDAGTAPSHQSLPRQGPGSGRRLLLPAPGDRGPFGGERAGKTTLLRCILGLVRFRGAVTLDGQPLTRGDLVKLSFASCEHTFFPPFPSPPRPTGTSTPPTFPPSATTGTRP